MSKLVAEYLQHPLSASANIALLDDGNVGGVLGATLGSKLDVAGGKILQIVRATDTTNRTTSSTSLTDTGISITITPQKSDSAILLLLFARGATDSSNDDTIGRVVLTDNSNNEVGVNVTYGNAGYTGTGNRAVRFPIVNFGWATPAVITAVTYKARFRVDNASNILGIYGGQTTTNFLAIEVSA